MFNIDGILKALQNDPGTRRTATTGAVAGAAGLAAGMLMGKKGSKMLGKAAKYGAVAALGGLAYHAWQRSQGGAAAPNPGGPTPGPDADYEAPPANETAFLPPPQDEEATDKLGKSLVRAMIAAAKADGKIDAEENQRIFERLEALNLDPQTKAFVFDEMSAPLNLDAVVADADTPEHAAEIYAASLVAIEADTAAEQAYLQMLAARLGLQPALVDQIHLAADQTV
ncbi:MAG: tellurite resistance TerB family protein [Pseudomonadota bacterium]